MLLYLTMCIGGATLSEAFEQVSDDATVCVHVYVIEHYVVGCYGNVWLHDGD